MMLKIDTEESLTSLKRGALLLICLLTILIYSGTMWHGFVFDDISYVIENPLVTSSKPMMPWDIEKEAVPEMLWDTRYTRYIGSLSFWLNRVIVGMLPVGFRITNLLLHIVNVMLVYVLSTQISSILHDRYFGSSKTKLEYGPLAAALLFAAHPLQTEAVTYISQRFTLVVALFYICTIISYIKHRTSGRFIWYCAALLTAMLAAISKENAATLPLIIFLIETALFSAGWRAKLSLIAPFLLVPIAIVLGRIESAQDSSHAFVNVISAGSDYSAWEYFLTQASVLLTYLRLLFLPYGQNLDYDYPVNSRLLDVNVLAAVLTHALLIALAIKLLWDGRRGKGEYWKAVTGFGVLFYYIAISVESSVIPLVNLIFEHRMYLPSAGVFIVIALNTEHLADRHDSAWLSRSLVLLLIVIILVFSALTYKRNKVWVGSISLWSDVITKSPAKARGYYNLGTAYLSSKRTLEAAVTLEAALKLDPENEEVAINLASAYEKLKRFDKAEQLLMRLMDKSPDFAAAHFNMGRLKIAYGDYDGALAMFARASELDPDNADAILNMCNLNVILKRLPEAVLCYNRVLKIDTNNAGALTMLSLIHNTPGYSLNHE